MLSFVDLDPEISNGAVELRMPKEELYGSQVARLLVNEPVLFGASSACRMLNYLGRRAQPIDGRCARTGVSTGGDASGTGSEIALTCSATEVGQPISDSASGLLRTEPVARLLLDDRRSIANRPARAHVVDFDQTRSQPLSFAINGEIEHPEITFAASQLEPDRIILRLQRAFLTDQASLVPGLAASRQGIGFSMAWSPLACRPLQPQHRSTSMGWTSYLIGDRPDPRSLSTARMPQLLQKRRICNLIGKEL
jgi:hypothetical protein